MGDEHTAASAGFAASTSPSNSSSMAPSFESKFEQPHGEPRQLKQTLLPVVRSTVGDVTDLNELERELQVMNSMTTFG